MDDTPSVFAIFISWLPMLMLIGSYYWMTRYGVRQYRIMMKDQLDELRRHGQFMERVAVALETRADTRQ